MGKSHRNKGPVAGSQQDPTQRSQTRRKRADSSKAAQVLTEGGNVLVTARQVAKREDCSVLVLYRDDGSKTSGLATAWWPKEDWGIITAAARSGNYAVAGKELVVIEGAAS